MSKRVFEEEEDDDPEIDDETLIANYYGGLDSEPFYPLLGGSLLKPRPNFKPFKFTSSDIQLAEQCSHYAFRRHPFAFEQLIVTEVLLGRSIYWAPAACLPTVHWLARILEPLNQREVGHYFPGDYALPTVLLQSILSVYANWSEWLSAVHFNPNLTSVVLRNPEFPLTKYKNFSKFVHNVGSVAHNMRSEAEESYFPQIKGAEEYPNQYTSLAREHDFHPQKMRRLGFD